MSEKLCKLTDQNGQTHGATQWGVDVTHTAPGGDLCTGGVLYAYRDPLLGLLLNPIHGDFRNPRLWEAEGEVCNEDWGKVGCTSLTTLVELPLPEITMEMQVRFAVLCAAQVPQPIAWLMWAESWWAGRRDRSVSRVDGVGGGAEGRVYGGEGRKKDRLYQARTLGV